MPQISVEISVEDVKKLLPRFSKAEILELDKKIHEYLETEMMMKIAKSGFAEWADPEEDIYNEYI